MFPSAHGTEEGAKVIKLLLPTAPTKAFCVLGRRNVYQNDPKPPLTHARNPRNHAPSHAPPLLGVRERARKDRFMSLLGGRNKGLARENTASRGNIYVNKLPRPPPD